MSTMSVTTLVPLFSRCRLVRAISLALATALLLLLFLPRSYAAEQQCSGKVVGVSDGDTITVLCDGRTPRKVRLFAVDAPELAQPYGRRAKEATSDLVFGEQVIVRYRETDQYGRVLGLVEIAPGRYLNDELVAAGYAWWYQHYAPNADHLRVLEEIARKAERGLWREAAPVPPWVWRSEHKNRVLPKNAAPEKNESVPRVCHQIGTTHFELSFWLNLKIFFMKILDVSRYACGFHKKYLKIYLKSTIQTALFQFDDTP